MLDERTGKALQTRDERKNVIASVAKQSLIVLFVAIFFSACTDYVAQIEDKIEESERILTGFVNDSRDGQTYKTVKIGNQTWMAQNLNYEMADSYCYNDNSANCSKYGRLYTWAAASSACPSGWHLPSKAELETLIDAVGGKTTAGTKLKSTSGWYKDGDGTDAFAFSALPAGNRNDDYGSYDDKGSDAFFWSSTEEGSYDAYYMTLYYSFDDAILNNSYKNDGFSVRCLKDEKSEQMEKSSSSAKASSSSVAKSSSSAPKSSSSSVKVVDLAEVTVGAMTDSRDGKIYNTVTIGSQTWMSQNLNYETADSYCYNDSVSYCSKYGRLYTWAVAKDVCPSSWHLPSLAEWKALFTAVGGESAAGQVLKSTSGWNEHDGKSSDGSDVFSFSALPAGYRIDAGGYYGQSINANFWSSTEISSYVAFYMDLLYDDDRALIDSNDKLIAFSVRCLKD